MYNTFTRLSVPRKSWVHWFHFYKFIHICFCFESTIWKRNFSILCSWISSKQQIITLCTFIHILSSPLLSKAFVTRTKNSRLVNSKVSIYNVRGASKFCWLISISISNQMESHHVVCVSLAFLGQKKWLIWISFIKTNKKNTDRALIRTFFSRIRILY